MVAPVPYIHFDGVAADALRFYHGVFGGELSMFTFADFGRSDGPGDAIAHGMLTGPVDLSGADVGGEEQAVRVGGLMLSLLGTEVPAVLERWFAGLAEGGEVLDPLQARPWGDTDGTVRDRFGLVWLLGYEGLP